MEKFMIISAPAKIIIHGEHSVVYNKPALLAALDKRLTASIKLNNKNLSLTAKSDIPIGVGLGSSAALSVVSAAVIDKTFNLNLSKEQINEIAYDLERQFHGSPSGADNTVSTYGGFLWFRKELEYLKLIKLIDPKELKLIPEFVFINTGKPVETTLQMVAQVRKLYNRRPKYTQKILNDQEIQTKKCLTALKTNKPALLKESIRLGQRNLEKLGVVSDKTKMLIRALEMLGASAKISGAGGKLKNSGLLIVYHKNPDIIYQFAKQQRLNCIKAKLGQPGLTIKTNQ